MTVGGPRQTGRLPHADDVLLPTDVAASAVGVETSTLRDWVRRGLLNRAGGTVRKPLWRASDLLKAQAAAKPRHATKQRVVDPTEEGPR